MTVLLLDPVAEAATLAEDLAAALSEPNVILLRDVVAVIGAERCLALLEQAQAIEAQGGLLTKSKPVRRRTPGGVFFRLVRDACTTEERNRIFPRMERPERPALVAPTPAAVAAALDELKKVDGGTSNVKITLIGRPVSKPALVGDSVLIQMAGGPPGDMPKGLPAPPKNTAQTFAVFIAQPTWRKVEAALKDQTDSLIIEGWSYTDHERRLNIVLARSAISKNLQRKKQAAAKAAAAA